MNYMEKVAEMLGVELGEEFEIKNCGAIYYFDQHGLVLKLSNETEYDHYRLEALLNGSMTIKKQSWKPKKGENYFAPYCTSANFYMPIEWKEDLADIRYYERGLVCRTPEEAIEKAKKMLEAINE